MPKKHSASLAKQAGCSDNDPAVAEDDDVDASELVFDWSSGFGAAWTDTTGTADSEWSSEWSGKATDETEITVTVTGGGISEMSESVTITIRPRSNWRFQEVQARWFYNPALPVQRFGFYYLPPSTPSTVPSATEGSGPWEDRYYMNLAPSPNTEIWINVDYSTNGPKYSGARGTCPPLSNSLASEHRELLHGER